MLCFQRGGLQDKPGKPRDFYHSCYALSGLSISQSCMATSSVPSSRQNEMQLLAASFSSSSNQAHRPIDFRWTGAQVYGDVNNLLEPTSAIFNIGLRKLRNVLSHFKDRPSTHSELVASYNNFRVWLPFILKNQWRLSLVFTKNLSISNQPIAARKALLGG